LVKMDPVCGVCLKGEWFGTEKDLTFGEGQKRGVSDVRTDYTGCFPLL